MCKCIKRPRDQRGEAYTLRGRSKSGVNIYFPIDAEAVQQAVFSTESAVRSKQYRHGSSEARNTRGNGGGCQQQKPRPTPSFREFYCCI